MLNRLDESLQSVALALHATCESYGSTEVRFSFRATPNAGVLAPDYWFTMPDGSVRKDIPDQRFERLVEDGALQHWRLTQELGQPPWYMMTVRVGRNGPYSADFE